MVANYYTHQTAYAGQFAVMIDNGWLIPGGGVDAPRPRLYDTAEAAIEAAKALDCTRNSGPHTPVLLCGYVDIKQSPKNTPLHCDKCPTCHGHGFVDMACPSCPR